MVNSGRRQRLSPVSLSVRKMRRRRSSPAMLRKGSAGWITGVSTRSVLRSAKRARSSVVKEGASRMAIIVVPSGGLFGMGKISGYSRCRGCSERLFQVDIAGVAIQSNDLGKAKHQEAEDVLHVG